MEDCRGTGPPDNGRIIRFLKRHAALMELGGLNAFRVRAFDNAARMLEELEVDITEMSEAGTLTEIDGIGKGVAAFIAEYIDSGTTAAWEALTEEVPETLLDLLRIPGLGGMLHVHTRASDGVDTLEEMVDAARRRGHEYVAICDHSKSAGPVYGMKEADVEEQHRQIDALQAEPDIRILKGIESEVRKGRLPRLRRRLPRELRSGGGGGAPHHGPGGSRADPPRGAGGGAAGHLGPRHPGGRILLERDGFPFDLEEVLAAAAAHGLALELNAHPARLDLDWRWLRRARDLGAPIAVNTDAHRTADLDNLDLGIGIARKGWLTAADVINTLSADDLLRRVRRRT